MDTSLILEIVKDAIGIRSTARDIYLSAIIAGVVKELEDEKGVTLEITNGNHLMFVVDYSVWKYANRGADTMPRHLQFRLNNLIIHNTPTQEVVT